MSYDKPPLRERARGQWLDIIRKITGDSKITNGRNQPCPSCGGADRFRFTNHNDDGLYICNSCGGGDGIELIKLITGEDFKGAAERIESVLPGCSVTHRRAPEKGDAVKAVKHLVENGCKTIGAGDPVRLWLEHRVPGLRRRPDNLLFAPDARFARNWSSAAMVAKVHDPKGELVQAHRTFLTEDGKPNCPPGSKANHRLLMKGELPGGSAIRLAPSRDVLGVAEGIETALSASLMFDMPVWSLISARNLAQFKPPEGVKRLVIFADNDKSHTGHAAAYRLSWVLRKDKRISVETEVRLPTKEGWDWNDEHTKGQAA